MPARQFLSELPKPSYDEFQVAEAPPLEATTATRQEIFVRVDVSTRGATSL